MNSTDNGTFSLFCANVTGIESNCIYPNEQPITSKEALEAAVVRDYVVARFKNNYRNTANFVSANCLCKDCDNDSSDNPDEWVTPEDVRRAFPDVPLGIHYSRNHMKPKRGKAPRPKFHCILLTDAITDHEEYKRLAKLAHKVFPYFDTRAEDAAHFFFGTPDAHVEFYPGTITLNECLEMYYPDTEDDSLHVFSYKPRAGAEREIYRRIGDITISMRSTDYLQMPECVMNTVPVSLDSSEFEIYEAMESKMVTELDGVEIDAVNAAALTGKLCQLANGAIYTPDGNTVFFHERKLEALEDLIEGANGKPVLVAYWYKHDLARIQERFKVRELKSSKDIADWNAEKIPVAVIHPASAGHGLNLQAGGSTLIWFSSGDSYR